MTLESVLVLMESGEGRVLADATAVDRGLTWGETAAYGEWSERFVSRTLTAAIGIAAIDSSQFRPQWSWPEGTRSRPTTAGRCRWTRSSPRCSAWCATATASTRPTPSSASALDELGIDPHEPLWLDHDTSAQPERPVGSFTAWQGLGARAVVVTDRALHVFRDVKASRVHDPARPGAPTRRLGRAAPADAHRLAGRHHRPGARPGRRGRAPGPVRPRDRRPLVAAHALLPDGSVVLRGRGDGLEEEAEVKEWLGDRVETVWMHSTPTVRNLRNAVGLGGMTLGTLALLWGVLLTIAPPGGMPEALPAVLALGGFGALLVALTPDWMLHLKLEVKRRTTRARTS